jgi:hypothetical protein
MCIALFALLIHPVFEEYSARRMEIKDGWHPKPSRSCREDLQ